MIGKEALFYSLQGMCVDEKRILQITKIIVIQEKSIVHKVSTLVSKRGHLMLRFIS